jgi:hypothetical protein
VAETFVPYDVFYSQRVREAFTALIRSIQDSELLRSVFAAAKDIEVRLRVYPQFGQPLRDLIITNATLWYGIIPPLMVQYVIDEDRRQVLVGVPFRLLPGSSENRVQSG